ncbi:hypothetical protein GJQ55_05560 [Venatoribacter cucullus]|uniref:Uncharacterized protein n=1 Tax=Venatoribacter cucullus TaxID=2661630 RepID=A0A9X7UXS9_9GAMM|nr:hypothetical protein [Venatoribacter cucullus]QQD23978.1 hypothetical protein GJQ55_05560 [Venatoribacter cucullus]
MPLATRLESSKRCYWLCQTSGWNEWAGTTLAATPAWSYWAPCARKIESKKQKAKSKNKKIKNSSGLRPPKAIQVAAVFPAHSGQPAGKKSR